MLVESLRLEVLVQRWGSMEVDFSVVLCVPLFL